MTNYVCVVTLALAPSLSGATIYVADTTDALEDGSAEHPFDSIQEGIVAAQDGDTVLVAPGTYVELIDFLGKSIAVQSEGGASVTIIDGAGDGRVVTCLGGSPTLEGFTVTGGFLDGDGYLNGAGMRSSGSATVIGCVFAENIIGVQGQNIDDGNGAGFHGSGNLIDCTFIENKIFGAQDSDGGGAACGGTVTGCTFIDNVARHGAALAISGADVLNCRFVGNIGQSTLFLSQPWPGGLGPSVVNCEFLHNHQWIFDGVFSHGLLTNCTFWPNAVSTFGGYQVSLDNCIIANAVNPDPLFVDPLGADGIPGTLDDDLRLRFGSPAIDSGDIAAYSGPDTDIDGNPRFVDELLVPGGPIDMGAHEYQPCQTADADGSGAVDFGDVSDVLSASGPCSECARDIDGDRSIGFFDLMYLLVYWGACA